MILLTGYYHDAAPGRRAELLDCLRRNVENELFQEVHVFLEDPIADEASISHPALSAAKTRLIKRGRRLTYRYLFDYANRELAGQDVVIANADIFFDGTLARLKGYDLSGKLLCLSRWDVQPDGSSSFFDHPCSQDAWIFRTPIREFACDFHLGVPGCDNRLAWEAGRAGLALSNPSRSLRAHHIHLSRVRRYSERQRLAGPTREIPAELLGRPWLWFIVPCMGRLDDLRVSAESLLEQPWSSYVLVDYSCPDSAGRWLRDRDPNAIVVSVDGRDRFRGAEARNRGAAAADDDAILCFLDADVGAETGLSEFLLENFEEGAFLVPDRQGPGLDTALVCSKAAFNRVGGFDEAFLDWGEECADLKSALRRSGLVERCFPASLLTRHPYPNRNGGGLRSVPSPEINRAIHSAYRRAKVAVLEETGGNGVSRSALREIYSAIARRRLKDGGLIPEATCAAVAFRETMGYTIARLEAGASSHNNDLRPFRTIAAQLAGLQFTQVVASSVSPIEIEFLTSGKLYVLVGNDWDGRRTATDWLSKSGFNEGMPLVETRRGTGFEVWSLVGEASECYVLPTQVMLVAERLVRK